jgi:hypothetical protein
MDEALSVSTNINKGTEGLNGDLQGKGSIVWFRELQLSTVTVDSSRHAPALTTRPSTTSLG